VLKFRGLPFAVAKDFDGFGFQCILDWLGSQQVSNLELYDNLDCKPIVLLSDHWTNKFNGFALLHFKSVEAAQFCYEECNGRIAGGVAVFLQRGFIL